jgi:hypothetical protein
MLFKFKSFLLIVAALAVTAHAQQTKPLTVSDAQPVRNDDGGQAFIIDRLQSLSSLGPARKGTISEPQQLSIFVGSGWSDAILRERETTLGSLLASVQDESVIEALHTIGIKNRFGPTIRVERSDIGAGVFRDLDAQRLLATMISSGALERPTYKTIYVIFLDSTLQSTVGTLAAGKHYLAYHSAFTTSGENIRYVVVPFEADAPTGYEVALRSLIAAAVRPARLIR